MSDTKNNIRLFEPKPATTGHPIADDYIRQEVTKVIESLTPMLIDQVTTIVKEILLAGVPVRKKKETKP